mgnify:CR=1 FL=1
MPDRYVCIYLYIDIDESKTFSCGVCEEMGGDIIEIDALTVSR